MKKKKGRFLTALTQKSELPLAYIGRCAELYWVGGRELTVDGCRCVLTYEDELIELSCGGGRYRIEGQGFELRSYFDGKMKITGRIDRIGLERGEGEKSK